MTYNNGENRIIDFHKVLRELEVSPDSSAYILYDPKEFAKAELVDNTLSWGNVEQFITMKNGKKKQVPFQRQDQNWH